MSDPKTLKRLLKRHKMDRRGFMRSAVAAGATVVGPKPKGSLGLVGYPGSDDEIRALANEVWGAIDGRTVTEHAYGKGKVYWGRPLRDVLAALETPPDVEHTRPAFDTTVDWIHRRIGATDVYFVANQKDRAEDLEVRFRVGGKSAELWHPETGEIGPAAYSIEDGRTTVPLSLGPHESVFVVFREEAVAPSRILPRPTHTEIAALDGPWDVTFPEDRVAPPKVRPDRPSPWSTPGSAARCANASACPRPSGGSGSPPMTSCNAPPRARFC